MKIFSWQMVAMALGSLAMMLGVAMWLIAFRGVSPTILTVPFGVVFTAGGAYVKGKFETPPWLDDPKINAMVRSQPPPPGVDPLATFRFPAAARATSTPKILEATGVEADDEAKS